jgi:hypothetical protein
MDFLTVIFAISVLSGLVLMGLGYLIAFKQKLDLINGVDFSALTNRAAFANYVGYSILLTGLLMAAVGLLFYLQFVGVIGYLIGIFIVSMLPLPAFLHAKAKFTKKSTAAAE